MEIDLKVLGKQAIETSSSTKKMRLSENATSMVFQLFTKNIYSNPIGSVVREITSNCFDSHVEAKANAPVLIKKHIDSETNTTYISFIDYGVGMSPDRVENIYGVYFESSKRIDNTQIGGFGIGGKTPLAYKRSTGHGVDEYDNSFYVITNYNGIKYSYIIFEGAESPIISLLQQEKTKERNGTEVRIPVLEKDVYTFEKEMIRQLYYFENIIFDGFNNNSISNDYQIIRGKNFLFRGTNYSDYAHVCLGRVAYPIDYNVIGIDSNEFRLPIALRFEVGELNVIANREQLDYNESVIKSIKKKLVAAKDEVKQLLVKQYDNIVSLKDYFSVKNEFGLLRFSNEMSFNVGNIITYKDIDFTNFRFSFMKMPNDKQLFQFFFETRMYGKKTKSRYSNGNFEGGYDALKRNNNLYYYENTFVRKIAKQSYLKGLHTTYYIINRRNLVNNAIRSEIAELFNVHLDSTYDDNGKPVDYVQSLINMQEEYFAIVREYVSDYDSIEVPENYSNRKKNNILSPEIRNTTIPVKIFGNYNEKARVKLDVLFKIKEPIFYGTQDDENKLDEAKELFGILFNESYVLSRYSDYTNTFRNSNKQKILFIMMSKSNVKYMQYCQNAIHIDQFYNKMLYRKADMIIDYFKSYGIFSEYKLLNNFYKSDSFSKIDVAWGNVINEIKNHINSISNKNSNLYDYKYKLSKYFNLNNLELTAEQKHCLKLIDDLKMLDEVNSETLKHINLPYYISDYSDSLVNILKKVMIL